MANFTVKFYRTLLPQTLRDDIYRLFLKKVMTIFRKTSFYFKTKGCYLLSHFISFSNERLQTWAFMGKYGRTQYPGVDIFKYDDLNVKIYTDEEKHLPYIIHSHRKLYFPQKFKDIIVAAYKSLVLEQDEGSAHRYVQSYEIFKNKTLLDIGAAEGLIALDVIELVDFVYLFECDEDWVDALSATFEPWKNKIEIIRKYVSDKNDDTNITLDTFFEDKPIDNLFIKMDIEGAELDALNGASYIFDHAKKMDFSICTYHKETDKIQIPAFLKAHGQNYNFTKGHLCIDWRLRKGIVRSC